MTRLKKNYAFSSKRNIWRLIPTASKLLVIEERDVNTREVFFNCLKLDDGKVLFKNFQLVEKYWIGIEAVQDHIIFFHHFRKPDMPGHKGIFAFDILNKKIIWQNDDLLFLFANDDSVFVYQSTFEGRRYFVLDINSGIVIKEFGGEFSQINNLREESLKNDFTNSFLYPQHFNANLVPVKISEVISKTLNEKYFAGQVNWLQIDELVMFNFHEQNQDGTFNNYFRVLNLVKQKFILKETLNSKSKNLSPESFFVAGDQLFLLFEKSKFVVYKIIR
jgi:hypothetical protein